MGKYSLGVFPGTGNGVGEQLAFSATEVAVTRHKRLGGKGPGLSEEARVTQILEPLRIGLV